MTSNLDFETRANIKFCVDLGHTPTQTTKRKCSRSLVFKWHGRFREGRTSLNDDERCGRPRTVSTSMKNRIRDILDVDRSVTIRAIAEDVGASLHTVNKIIQDELRMNKCSARLVTRLLSSNDKSRRMSASMKFLRRCKRIGYDFLNRIITTDERWLWHYEPESKLQSEVWKTPAEKAPRKAKVSRSGGIHMFVFFADRRGMILQHRVPEGQTVNADYYAKVLRRDLVQSLRKKRPMMDLSTVILHQDNAALTSSHQIPNVVLREANMYLLF